MEYKLIYSKKKLNLIYNKGSYGELKNKIWY